MSRSHLRFVQKALGLQVEDYRLTDRHDDEEEEEEQEEEEDSNVAAFGSGESDWLLARLPEGVGRKGMLQHLEVAEERMPFADCAVARIEMQWLADEAAAGEMEEGGRQWFPVAFRHGAAAGLVE
mmetsp:Transcript_19653/g.38654  ORF Transcript_19653/g.38654 Transcript_19653/m.38654 type:complete len:125 (-) Transcript_19653:194-568(-)